MYFAQLKYSWKRESTFSPVAGISQSYIYIQMAIINYVRAEKWSSLMCPGKLASPSDS
jgi:hypothetical protein